MFVVHSEHLDDSELPSEFNRISCLYTKTSTDQILYQRTDQGIVKHCCISEDKIGIFNLQGKVVVFQHSVGITLEDYFKVLDSLPIPEPKVESPNMVYQGDKQKYSISIKSADINCELHFKSYIKPIYLYVKYLDGNEFSLKQLDDYKIIFNGRIDVSSGEYQVTCYRRFKIYCLQLLVDEEYGPTRYRLEFSQTIDEQQMAVEYQKLLASGKLKL